MVVAKLLLEEVKRAGDNGIGLSALKNIVPDGDRISFDLVLEYLLRSDSLHMLGDRDGAEYVYYGPPSPSLPALSQPFLPFLEERLKLVRAEVLGGYELPMPTRASTAYHGSREVAKRVLCYGLENRFSMSNVIVGYSPKFDDHVHLEFGDSVKRVGEFSTKFVFPQFDYNLVVYQDYLKFGSRHLVKSTYMVTGDLSLEWVCRSE